MTKEDASIDDLGEAINNLATSVDLGFKKINNKVDTRFDGVETRLSSLESHMGAQEREQIETNRNLEKIDGRLEAVEPDIKELYTMDRPKSSF